MSASIRARRELRELMIERRECNRPGFCQRCGLDMPPLCPFCADELREMGLIAAG